MMLRGPLATLMAFLLLTFSCVASACETSCDLKVLGSACHHAGAIASGSNHRLKHSGAGMSGMHDCGMSIADSSAKSPACVMVGESRCGHSVCEEPVQALASDKEASATMMATVQQAAIFTVLPCRIPEQVSRWQPSKPPLFRAPLLVSLQTLIRV
jgi:hypothetical protein